MFSLLGRHASCEFLIALFLSHFLVVRTCDAFHISITSPLSHLSASPQSSLTRTTTPSLSSFFETSTLTSSPSVATIRNNVAFTRIARPDTLLLATPKSNERDDDSPNKATSSTLLVAVAFTTVTITYWYLLVFGAAAAANDLPLIPNWLPMVPGWPPTDADLAPAVEDSIHFFYLSDMMSYLSKQQVEVPSPPALRLALFNIAEAWVFGFLPLLLEDKKRLPLPVVLFTWVGALGLTNAFLAPYLAARELVSTQWNDKNQQQQGPQGTTINDDASTDLSTNGEKNRVLSIGTGTISASVIIYALVQSITVLSSSGSEGVAQQLEGFRVLVTSDRTYLAFCVDLFLFGIFQAWLMQGVNNGSATIEVDDDNESNGLDNVPIVGLISWLFRS